MEKQKQKMARDLNFVRQLPSLTGIGKQALDDQ